MNNLLVLTDFSKSAKHAAVYACSLAKQIQAKIILCNVVIVPAEVPLAGFVAWPLEESDVLLKESEVELKKLKMQLEKMDDYPIPNSDISFRSDPGILLDVVKDISAEIQIDFVITAAHGSGLGAFLLGNHSRGLIDDIGTALFIIPPTSKIALIQKIAYATDFEDPDHEMKFIRKLIALANLLKAEVFITHVYKESDVSPAFYKSVQQIMLDISCENDYPKIHYKAIKNVSNKKGLDWLMAHGDMDLLVMVHHAQGFLDRIIRGSLTQKLAGSDAIPLLVFKKAPAP
ncbi:nucleotide-binding universal stress UspA family protein [Pedobacter cryoconitis]|uniref:Nucleotide-binding universal stress UspA family protein n=1 Tax=Pedobacter cryoconitis TaxID=188932 RepID=A0A7W9E0G3_9SPHI|nr:universal stress protein [Pedobacter cryoconitis]MBB5638377.1 nucleotide-binding universal stress UspA family protein [Pedobacter cryoconitis]